MAKPWLGPCRCDHSKDRAETHMALGAARLGAALLPANESARIGRYKESRWTSNLTRAGDGQHRGCDRQGARSRRRAVIISGRSPPDVEEASRGSRTNPAAILSASPATMGALAD